MPFHGPVMALRPRPFARGTGDHVLNDSSGQPVLGAEIQQAQLVVVDAAVSDEFHHRLHLDNAAGAYPAGEMLPQVERM